jgi:hypothetical protein
MISFIKLKLLLVNFSTNFQLMRILVIVNTVGLFPSIIIIVDRMAISTIVFKYFVSVDVKITTVIN